MRKISIPRQQKLIPAKGKAIIFEYRVPGGYICYITSMANLICTGVYYIVKIDGEPLWDKIDFAIASINNPRVLPSYVIAKERIIVVGYNDSDTDVTLEFFVDGFLKPKEEEK